MIATGRFSFLSRRRAYDGQLCVIQRTARGYRTLGDRTIFASRWSLAPFYIGLVVSPLVLLIKFGQKTVTLLAGPSSGDLMNTGPTSDHELAWSVGIMMAFVFSALLLAVMNRISPGAPY